MTPARLQWGAALGDAPRRFWRRSAAVARRLPQTAAHNDERLRPGCPSCNIFPGCRYRSSYKVDQPPKLAVARRRTHAAKPAAVRAASNARRPALRFVSEGA